MIDQTMEPVRRRRRKALTDKMVAALPKKAQRYTYADPEQRGHYVRVMPSGANVYAAVARDPYSKQIWATIGGADVLSIQQARERARIAIGRIKAGLPAFEPPPVRIDSVEAVAGNWLERHVEKNQLRTAAEIRRLVQTHILPAWADRSFADIRRTDIANLLDRIEDRHGAWTADAVLTVLRQIASWFATRNDNYVPPFVKNMKRVPAHARKRSRILSDDELRQIWRMAEDSGTFGALIRILLLTAQRRDKTTSMKWRDVSDDGVWTIPTQPREKGNAGVLRLPPQAMAIIKAQPRFTSNEYVFAASRGNGPVQGFTQLKTAFDRRSGVTGYSLHDLRRSSRTLLTRAQVPTEVAEAVLGHRLTGVLAVYSVHDYADEMGLALRKLAQLIETIVAGPSNNVVVMSERAAQP
jgi:integrase